MTINDKREYNKPLALDKCYTGDTVELDSLEGVFIVTDYHPRSNKRTVVRLSDGLLFHCDDCEKTRAITCELMITK